MSVTITNTTTFNDTTTGASGTYVGTLRLNGAESQDSNDICGHGQNKQKGNNLEALLDASGMPESLKMLLRNILGGQPDETLPSQASAVDTMQKYQKDNKIGLISFDQMNEMATKGTLNGKAVPENVQDAAKTYVANNGALFDKVESATTGKHDSLLSAADADNVDHSQLSHQPTPSGITPSSFMKGVLDGHISPNKPDDYESVKTMEKYQKDNKIGLISYDQMLEMANKGTLDGKHVPEEVQDAAKHYTANNGALFDKLESATNGKHDSKLSAGDAEEAVKKGIISAPPLSQAGAMDTMEKYQKDNKIGLISYDQMLEMAKKGTLNGKEVPPEVQQAAKTYVANNGALFDKIEAATDGKHDSKLGAGDPEKAREKGIAPTDYTSRGNHGSDTPVNGTYSPERPNQPRNTNGGGQDAPVANNKAVETMESYQRANKIDLISFDQMKEMATKGTRDGKPVPPAVQDAAKTYVANNGALFDKVESATNGKHDSKLSAGDAVQARDKGIVQMSDAKAVDTIHKLQSSPMGPGLISYDQMKEMADKGTLGGLPVSEDLRSAAKTYMANNAALFKKVESATNGEHDNKLSAGDAIQARDQGLVRA